MKNIKQRLRYRFKAPKRNKVYYINFGKKAKRKILVIIILSILSIGFYGTEKRVGHLAQVAAMSVLNNEINMVLNEVTEAVIESQQIDMNQILVIHKDGEEIKTVSTDYNIINKFRLELNLKLQEKFNEMDTIKAEVPLGMFFSDILMTGAGVKIPIKVFATSGIEINFYDEFSDAGINQTKYELKIEIKVPTQIAGVFVHEDMDVVTQIPISEMIIVGDVPNTYLNTKK